MQRILYIALVPVAILIAVSSCSSRKSYTELLADENHAVNLFLSNQRVAYSIPSDSVFEVGPDAPYYPIDESNRLFMQVLKVGDGAKVQDKQLVYFRYTRWSLLQYAAQDTLIQVDGNENTGFDAESFRFGETSLSSSTKWGTGIQKPLEFLPFNSEVNLVIKAELSKPEEASYVMPMLVNVRYFPPRL